MSVLGKFGTKNQNWQFKLKFGTYNHGHVLGLFGVLSNVPFTKSEMKCDH